VQIEQDDVRGEPLEEGDGLSGIGGRMDLRAARVAEDRLGENLDLPTGYPGVPVAFRRRDAARELGREPPETRRKVIVDALATYFGPRVAQLRVLGLCARAYLHE